MSTLRKRRLKVYYSYTGKKKKRPYIRLCGKYLQDMDFSIGESVDVAISQGTIVITKASVQS